MDLPPRIEEIACPTCGERTLQARTEGLGAECSSCGQLVIFDEDTSTVGKRRNYTPDRQLKKMLGVTPASPPHQLSPAHLPDGPPVRESLKAPALEHRGPLPSVKSTESLRPPVGTSHALESVRRDHWKKRLAFFAILLVILGVSFWAWREQALDRKDVALAPIGSTLSDPVSRMLVDGSILPENEANVVAARNFLSEKILPALAWEDWLPHVRLPERVEPLMRSYYADHQFQPLAKAKIESIRTQTNPAGNFVLFVLDHPSLQIAMVELGGDGPRLDWEIIANQPRREWEAFLKSRPSAPTTLPAVICRCYVRDSDMTAEELPKRTEFLGVRIRMPGNPHSLFSAVPLASPLGQSLANRLPWEHDERHLMAQVTLSFAPEHDALKERVVLRSEPMLGWNRTPATMQDNQAGPPPTVNL